MKGPFLLNFKKHLRRKQP